MRVFRSLLLGLAAAFLLVQVAAAQLMLTGAGGPPASGAACISGPTLCANYQGHFESITDVASGSNYTQTSAALGPATSDRIIILVLQSGSAGASSVGTPTIGGTAMTQIIGSSTNTIFEEFWYLNVPSGTTANIVVPVASGTLSRMAFDWWSITGTTQTTWAARSAATSPVTSQTTLTSPAITVPSGGIAIAMARSSIVPATWGCNSGVSGSGQTWTITVGSANNLSVAAIAWGP